MKDALEAAEVAAEVGCAKFSLARRWIDRSRGRRSIVSFPFEGGKYNYPRSCRGALSRRHRRATGAGDFGPIYLWYIKCCMFHERLGFKANLAALSVSGLTWAALKLLEEILILLLLFFSSSYTFVSRCGVRAIAIAASIASILHARNLQEFLTLHCFSFIFFYRTFLLFSSNKFLAIGLTEISSHLLTSIVPSCTILFPVALFCDR